MIDSRPTVYSLKTSAFNPLYERGSPNVEMRLINVVDGTPCITDPTDLIFDSSSRECTSLELLSSQLILKPGGACVPWKGYRIPSVGRDMLSRQEQ